MSDNTLATEQVTDTANDAQEVENQAQEATKTYTQKEVDDMMARMRGSIERKVLKPYEELGDPDTLRELKIEAEKRQQEQQIKRGEFEKTLQELAAKKDAEISKRDQVIKEYKINTPLLNAAAKHRSVNPDQVKALLSNNIRLNQEGEVEVVDETGNVRYTDAGTAVTVDDYVSEWLKQNPHFVQPTPSTTNTKSNIANPSNNGIDLNNLDMSNPEHRKAYAEARKSGRIK